MTKKLAIFDLCFTLFNSNTTLDFIKFLLKKKGVIHILYFNLIFYICEITHLYDTQRKFIISKFKVLNGKNIDTELELFFDKVLQNKKFNKVIHELEYYSNNKDYNVFIISASVDIIVKYISERYKVNFFATEIEKDNNKIMGKIKKDLLIKGRKESILNEIILKEEIYDLKSSYCFSDSIDDLIQWKIIHNRFLVNTKGEFNKF